MSNVLKDYGTRVQYSVFECIIDDFYYHQMVSRLEDLIDVSEDSVRIYRLDADNVKHIVILGQGEVLEDKDFYIV